MRYVWESTDIYAGRRIIAHNETEEYIIGYFPLRERSTGNYTLISLRDGMVCNGEGTAKSSPTDVGLAMILNEGSYRPLTLGNPHAKNPTRT